MFAYTSFWERVAEGLKNEHLDKQHPYEWKKSEIESFITDRFLVRIDNYLKANQKHTGQSSQFSYYTFRRIFQNKEKYSARLYTKNLFAWYFGCADADDYLKKEQASNQLQLATINEFLYQAMQTEFNAYKSVPKYSEAAKQLKNYFLPSGPASKKIIGVLENQTARGWVLTNPNNPSAYEIIDVKIKETFKDKAIIETHEHWVLQWYCSQQHDYRFRYSNTNRQSYILKKTDGQWKIWSNSYPAPEKYLPPLEIDPELKEQIHAQSGLACRSFLLELIEAGRTNVAFYLFKVKLKDKKHLNTIIILKSQFDKLIDRVNNEKISMEEFYLKKGEIDLKLLDLLESL